ncbi:MAG: outer membrane beta-barrel protein [Gemmatimonadetes bacterium]|nr:outer membrane beta-barrel protein [Gemmatimonadota bacterium]
MRRILVAAAFTIVLQAFATPAEGLAQGRFDPRRQARFMIDANLAYTLITGDAGDSINGGPGIEAAALYQLADIPLRLGGGAGYSRHGIQDAGGSANRYEVFAVADLLLFSEETEMIPYIQGRVGWMQLANNIDEVSTTISGLEFAALVGVDMPVAENISIDVSGQFGWFTGGDLVVDGVSDPGTSMSGSIFSIRAGAFFFF